MKTFENYDSLVSNFSKYLKMTEDVADTFGGPSLYFHMKALEWCDMDFLSERHLEYIYATLASWGMHRMGPQGAKMPAFDVFSESIVKLRDDLRMLSKLRIEELSKTELEEILPKLTSICFLINASDSQSLVVSSSKTLAHILPNLVCPMDRNYTLDFFNTSLGSIEKEQKFFQLVMRQMWTFFQDEVCIKSIILGRPFNMSYPKVFDNLIIAYMKANPNK